MKRSYEEQLENRNEFLSNKLEETIEEKEKLKDYNFVLSQKLELYENEENREKKERLNVWLKFIPPGITFVLVVASILLIAFSG